MNLVAPNSQVRLDQNKSTFNYFLVKSNSTSVSESFGQWLIRQRKLLGLNQTDFAKRAQITKAALSLYEKDAVDQPRFKQLDKIARALGKSPEEVRRAASPPLEETHDVLEGVVIMFQDEAKLSPEEKEKILEIVRTVARGVKSERGTTL